MTVSLSLRDSPKISEATRRRVRSVAESLGYRPDPEVARLMGRLRRSRLERGSVTIALLDLRRNTHLTEHPYNVLLRKGAGARADSLGLGVSLFRLSDYEGDERKVLRVIRSRGIPGVILLPSDEPVTLQPTLKWDGLSVVSATTSVLAPRFHRVVPNIIYNAIHLIEAMRSRGYLRIGLILSDSLEQRTAHFYSMVALWYGHGERVLILPDRLAIHESDELITQWLHKQQPDLVVAQNTEVIEHLLPRGGRAGKKAVGLVSLSTLGTDRIAHQNELPDHVGACAVSLIAGMIHNNETGIPVHPQVTTIDGEFCEGPTVRTVRRIKASTPRIAETRI